MSLLQLRSLLSHPWAYLLWQRPFVRDKLAPFFRHNPQFRAQTLIDVGCGPGTNVPLLSAQVENYIGIDLSSDYTAYASKAYPDAQFIEADASHARTFSTLPKPDTILMNSLMHHLTDAQTEALLREASNQLRQNESSPGQIHVVDLILPESPGLPRLLARLDRGEHPRSVPAWRCLLDVHFHTEIFEEFTIGVGPITLWKLFYWRGTPKRVQADGAL